MASKKNKDLFIIAFVIVAAVVTILITIQLSKSSYFINVAPRAKEVLPVPTSVPINPVTDKKEIHSPDGKFKVVMEKTGKSGDLSVYTFTVSDVSGENSKTIFSKTLSDSQIITVPANTFSPDNKLIFLKEKDSDILSFFVFKADGSPFPDGREFVDVVPLFTGSKEDLRIADITGWDSETLLHVFTQKEDGNRGPSYWFEVPSKAFMGLGTY